MVRVLCLTIWLDNCGPRGAESRRKSKSRHHALGSHLRTPNSSANGTHSPDSATIGKSDASRKQKNISLGGLGSQGDVVVQG
jgi:hypothetical protein